MRVSTVFAASASLLTLAHARITGVGVPQTIKPGDTFNLIIVSENYIQSVTDVAIAVGYSSGAPPTDSLGRYVNAYYLGTEKSNQLHNFNETVTFPADAVAGLSTFTASLTSLYGAAYSPTLTPFNVTFTVGDVTSTTYAYSAV